MSLPAVGPGLILRGVLRFGHSAAIDLRVLYESQIEGCKHQDNADVHYQPFPESIPKEEQIHANYDGYQHSEVKADQHTLCHLNVLSPGEVRARSYWA
jgi:hypothetical protein